MGAATKHNCQDSVDPSGLTIDSLREQVVPEVGMVDVCESRPAEGPSQAADEVDHEHHRPAMAVHEVAAHDVDIGPQTERYEHMEKAAGVDTLHVCLPHRLEALLLRIVVREIVVPVAHERDASVI